MFLLEGKAVQKYNVSQSHHNNIISLRQKEVKWFIFENVSKLFFKLTTFSLRKVYIIRNEYMYAYDCIYGCLSTCTHMTVFMRVWVHVRIWLYLWVFEYMYAYDCIYGCLSTCTHMTVFMGVCDEKHGLYVQYFQYLMTKLSMYRYMVLPILTIFYHSLTWLYIGQLWL